MCQFLFTYLPFLHVFLKYIPFFAFCLFYHDFFAFCVFYHEFWGYKCKKGTVPFFAWFLKLNMHFLHLFLFCISAFFGMNFKIKHGEKGYKCMFDLKENLKENIVFFKKWLQNKNVSFLKYCRSHRIYQYF